MKRLTPAELRALDAYSRHGSVKAAAYALGRSPRTVDQQLKSARTRLGVAANVQAVRAVYDPASVKRTDIGTEPA